MRYTMIKMTSGLFCLSLLVGPAGLAEIKVTPSSPVHIETDEEIALVNLEAPPYVLPGEEFTVEAFISNVELRGYQVTLTARSGRGFDVVDVEIYDDHEQYVFAYAGSDFTAANQEKGSAIAALFEGSVTIPVEDESNPPAYLATFTIRAPKALGKMRLTVHKGGTLFRSADLQAISFREQALVVRVVGQLPIAQPELHTIVDQTTRILQPKKRNLPGRRLQR